MANGPGNTADTCWSSSNAAPHRRGDTGPVVGAQIAKGRSTALVMLIGVIMMAGGIFLAARATPESELIMFLPTVLLVGVGVIFISLPQAREYVAQAPPKFLSAVVSSRTSVG